jgi:type VI secretion system protein
MCSTRLGTMLTQPDYGIPDVTEMLISFPEAIAALQRALKHTIETYEPRLTNVRVNYAPSDTNDLIVRFDIVAQLVTDTGKSPVKFETLLELSRKISVR